MSSMKDTEQRIMHIINNPENLVLYDRNSEIHKAFNVLQDNMYMCFEITLKNDNGYNA